MFVIGRTYLGRTDKTFGPQKHNQNKLQVPKEGLLSTHFVWEDGFWGMFFRSVNTENGVVQCWDLSNVLTEVLN